MLFTQPYFHAALRVATHQASNQLGSVNLWGFLKPFDAAVWIVNDGHAVRVPVETGVEGVSKTEIRKGLEPGQAIIAEPPEGLAAGDRLRVEP